jgi:sugar lactone lactonase YvrE
MRPPPPRRNTVVFGSAAVTSGTTIARRDRVMEPARLSAPDFRPIHLRADPNGVAYDAHGEALYVADGNAGAIIRVAGETQQRIATLPAEGVISDRLAGLAVTPYGTLYVTRVGYGTSGGVIRIEPDGTFALIPNLPTDLYRCGITYDAHQHVLYVTQFRKTRTGPTNGMVIEIDLQDDFVSPLVEGFMKPVGVARLGDTLVVADAGQRALFAVEMEEGRAKKTRKLVDDIDRPDTLCALADSLLVTTYEPDRRFGALRRVWLDGKTQILAQGPWEPRGVDTDGRYAFVAARRASRVLVFEIT